MEQLSGIKPVNTIKYTLKKFRTLSDLFRMMFRDVIGGEDVVGEAAGHHDLAGVQLEAGVPEARPELQVGAVHPGAGLVL